MNALTKKRSLFAAILRPFIYLSGAVIAVVAYTLTMVGYFLAYVLLVGVPCIAIAYLLRLLLS